MMVMGVLWWAIPQAIGLTSNPPTLGTWKTVGTSLAVIFVLIGVLWHFMDLQSALDEIHNIQPNVVAEHVCKGYMPTTLIGFEWLELNGMASGTTGLTTDPITRIINPDIRYRSQGTRFEVYYVEFRNKVLNGKGTRDAEDIHARLIFTNGKTILHEKSRWVGKPTPDLHQEEIIIKANGKAEGLYLVIRELGSRVFYIFSDDSYTQNIFEPLKGNLKLVGDNYLIKIELQDKHGWHKDYSVQLTIENGEPIFEVMST